MTRANNNITPTDNNSQQPPPKWHMCTEKEGKERETFNEISEFESKTSKNKPHNNHKTSKHTQPQGRLTNTRRSYREGDAQLCIQKYRRSAAAGGASSKMHHRSVQELKVTVSHLVHQIFCEQRSFEGMSPTSLIKTGNFMNDRLRAVQVDLLYHIEGDSGDYGNTNSSSSLQQAALPQQPSSGNTKNLYNATYTSEIQQMQITMIRYHILISYLLCDIPPQQNGSTTFEHKFNQQALEASITSSLDTFQYSHVDFLKDNIPILDEIMCYYTLLQARAKIISRHATKNSMRLTDDSSFLTKFHTLFCDKATFSSEHDASLVSSLFPKWKWSIQVYVAVEDGNFIRFFQLLKEQDKQSCRDWKILARCCVAIALPYIRYEMLLFYNKGFAKSEEVTGTELARLLYMPSSTAAISFCECIIGLPKKTRMSIFNEEEECIVFKNVSIDGIDTTTALKSKREDSFIFGGINADKMRREGRMDDDHIFIPKKDILLEIIH